MYLIFVTTEHFMLSLESFLVVTDTLYVAVLVFAVYVFQLDLVAMDNFSFV